MKKQNIVVLFLSLLLGLGGGLLGSKIGINSTFSPTLSPENEKNTHVVQSRNVKFAENALPEGQSFNEAINKSIDAVVHVKTKTYVEVDNPLYYMFFGNQVPTLEGAGSGVIISNDGYIVTNNHVIENSNTIKVILSDKREYKAKLVGRDPSTDLALLKIDADNLPVIKFGNSDELKIGDWVLAIGNPFNLTSTVTAGIVSAKSRSIDLLKRAYAVESFIQTDAAVNPGNSGGALINTEGELVGINTAIASKTGSYTGYSFAIPSNIVNKIVEDLIEFGRVQRAVLGVSLREVDANIARKLDMAKIRGVLITETADNGAAQVSGLKPGDVIIEIGNKQINKVSEFQEEISRHRPGDKINVKILRKNKEKTIEVKLTDEYGRTAIVARKAIDLLGATFENISPEELSTLGISNGVRVVDLGSGKLLRAGVRPGFIIVLFNKQPVTSVKQLEKLVEETHGGVMLQGIYPDGRIVYYAFGL